MKIMRITVLAMIIAALTLPVFAIAQDEKTLTGIVVDAGMNGFTLEVAPETRLSFNVEQGSINTDELTEGLLIGKVVEICYTGSVKLQKEDTSSAHISSISDGDIHKMIYRTHREEDGEQESFTQVVQLGSGYLMWYDTSIFKIDNGSETGDFLKSVDEKLDLSLQVQIDDSGAEGVEAALSDLKEKLSAQDYTLTAADCSELPEDYIQGGWICNKDGREMQVFVVEAAAGLPLYRITLSYPQESANSWAARLLEVLSTFRLL